MENQKYKDTLSQLDTADIKNLALKALTTSIVTIRSISWFVSEPEGEAYFRTANTLVTRISNSVHNLPYYIAREDKDLLIKDLDQALTGLKDVSDRVRGLSNSQLSSIVSSLDTIFVAYEELLRGY